MRPLILFFLTIRGITLIAQTAPESDLLKTATVTRSTDTEVGRLGRFDEKPADEGFPTEIRTDTENSPWWEIDLKTPAQLQTLRFENAAAPQPYYILLSAYPMLYPDLKRLLASPSVRHIYISDPPEGQTEWPLGNHTARYVRIPLAAPGRWDVRNPVLTGDPDKAETGGNGLDDDADGQTDCGDPAVRPAWLGVVPAPPSCLHCTDGALYIRAGGDDLSLSLDGGMTFRKISGREGLYNVPAAEGSYHLVLSDEHGCTAEYPYGPVEIRPGTPEEEACSNGNFDNGWSGWSGALGYHTYTGVLFNQNLFDPAGIRHDILGSNPSLNDPTVGPLIPLGSPSGSGHFARLGDLTYANNNAQMLQYCFTVTPANAHFSFWYAAVLYDGEHPQPDQSLFQYTILGPDNLTILTHTVNPGPGAGMNLFNSHSGIYYLPWDCVSSDLTPYIGQKLCIQFISSGCSYAGHGGYAYIDGLCQAPAAPVLNLPSEVCLDPGNVNATATGGGGFQDYYWQVEQVDPAGKAIPGTTATGPLLSASPIAPFQNILGFWRSYFPNAKIPCDTRFRVSISLEGQCSNNTATASGIFTATCPPFPIDYCNLEVCSGNPGNVQMQGSGTCIDCQYNWSPAGNLNDIQVEFPVIVNPAGAAGSYFVTVTDAGGCRLKHTVTVRSTQVLNGAFIAGFQCNDACTVVLTAAYITDAAFDLNAVAVRATEYGTNTNVSFAFQSVESLSNGFRRYNFVSVPVNRSGSGSNGANPVDYFVRMSPVAPPGFCMAGDCSQTGPLVHVLVSRGIFWGYPDVYVPNVFQITAVNPVNQVFNPFFSGGNPHPGVYWIELSVYDRFGGLMYTNQDDMYPSCSSVSGLVGNEPGFPWNGHINNDPNAPLANQGVYTWVVKFRNCQSQWQLSGDVALLW